MEHILRDSCGFVQCQAPEVLDAIRNAAKQFSFETFNESGPEYNKVVSELRQRFRSLPDVLSDVELDRQRLWQDIFSGVVETSGLMQSDDIDR
jgi:hypothetical protein